MNQTNYLLLAAILALAGSLAWAQSATGIGAEMAARASAFLSALGSAERDRASLGFGDANRYDWHYIPRERQGLPLKAMSAQQRALADALMDTALSDRGREKARGIRQLDQVLFERERRAIRDSELYYVTVFGEPADEGAWGWRVEGHHLSLNLTIEDGEIISTSPTFMGANPAIVREGARTGMQVLEHEQNLARELLRSFNADLRSKVVYSDRPPRDIETRASRRAEPGDPRGLALGEMTSAQAELLRQLIAIYASRIRPELAASTLQEIRDAGEAGIHFAWAGSAEAGEPHYYRIHGPTFLIEYDNRQNGANHIHSVWRDLNGGDFGEDLLARHYAESPHHNASPRFAYVDASTLETGLLSPAERDDRATRAR